MSSNAVRQRTGPANTVWATTLPTVTLLTLGGLLVVGQMYTVLALFVPMGSTFGVPPTSLAWTATAFGFAYAVGFLVAGPLTDRVGPRTMITVGLAVTAMTTALVAVAPTLGSAIVLRVLQGLTAAMFTPAAFSYVAHHIRPERRAVALSCITSSLLAAAVVMQVGAQIVEGLLDWQAVFVICAPLFLLTALAAWFTLRPSSAEHTTSIATAFRAMPRLVAQPRLVTLYLATMTLLGGFVAIYTAITLAGPAGVANHPDTMLALRASALPAMVVIPLVAPLLARFAPLTRVVVGLATAALAALGASFLGGSIVALAGLLLIFVAAVVATAPALVDVISAAAAGHNRSTATALYAFAMFTGGSVGGQLVSAGTGLGFSAIVLIIAGVLVVGTALAAASLRRT